MIRGIVDAGPPDFPKVITPRSTTGSQLCCLKETYKYQQPYKKHKQEKSTS